MLSQEEKTALIKQYAVHEGDTGSPEVQIAVLTSRIAYLTEHLRSQKGSSLTARPLEDGRTSPPALELPLQQGYRALSFHHR